MTRPRAIELFAGFGGLSRAIEDVFDAETVAMSEIEPAALQILGRRYPDVASLGDVARVDWHRVNRLYGPIDIIGGGFPCTDVSSTGKMAGLSDGTRSGLWTHFAKAVSILRPKMVVIENVRGLLSTKAGRGNAPDPALHPLLRQLIEESDAEAAADPSGDDLGSDDEDLGDDDGRPVLLRALGAVLGDLAGIGFDAAWHGLRAAVTATRTAGSVSSSAPGLLPTPRTTDGNGVGAHGQGGVDLRTAISVLPTPTASDGDRTSATYSRGNPTLTGALPPTPTAQLQHDSQTHRSGARTEELLLGGIALAAGRGQLLPTPTTTQRGPDANVESRPGAGPNLHNSVMLLPTGDLTPQP